MIKTSINLAKLKRGQEVLKSNRAKLKSSRAEVERRMVANNKEMKLQAKQTQLNAKINKYEEMKNKIIASDKKRAEETRQALLTLKNKTKKLELNKQNLINLKQN